MMSHSFPTVPPAISSKEPIATLLTAKKYMRKMLLIRGPCFGK